MSKKFAAVKGMNDLFAPRIETWNRLEQTAREVFGRYCYSEVRTPVVEDTELFTRSVGETSDIVGKEMYTFTDRGERSLSLRPEGTAPAARAYIEHSINQQEPVTRWFYLGPMFRYERMKTGRYRQFSQLGCEAYGAAEPAQDVEVMELAVHFLNRLGLDKVRLTLNSLGDETTRPAYQAKVAEHFLAHRATLSPGALETLERNPLRLLDSKEPELKPLIDSAPVMVDFLDEGSKAHFAEVRRLLEKLGVPYSLNPRLVRGLDYYTRTAFELISDDPVLGTAAAVGGGGRYDRLVEQLGGAKTPAVGFAMGIERLCILLDALSAPKTPAPAVFFVSLDAAAADEVVRQVTTLRHAGIRADFDARAGSFKSQTKRADKSGARYVVMVGERELATGVVELKPQYQLNAAVKEEARKVPLAELLNALNS